MTSVCGIPAHASMLYKCAASGSCKVWVTCFSNTVNGCCPLTTQHPVAAVTAVAGTQTAVICKICNTVTKQCAAYRVPRKQWSVVEHLYKDTANGPDVHRSGVRLSTQQYLRSTIPQCHDLNAHDNATKTDLISAMQQIVTERTCKGHCEGASDAFSEV